MIRGYKLNIPNASQAEKHNGRKRRKALSPCSAWAAGQHSELQTWGRSCLGPGHHGFLFPSVCFPETWLGVINWIDQGIRACALNKPKGMIYLWEFHFSCVSWWTRCILHITVVDLDLQKHSWHSRMPSHVLRVLLVTSKSYGCLCHPLQTQASIF